MITHYAFKFGCYTNYSFLARDKVVSLITFKLTVLVIAYFASHLNTQWIVYENYYLCFFSDFFALTGLVSPRCKEAEYSLHYV